MAGVYLLLMGLATASAGEQSLGPYSGSKEFERMKELAADVPVKNYIVRCLNAVRMQSAYFSLHLLFTLPPENRHACLRFFVHYDDANTRAVNACQ